MNADIKAAYLVQKMKIGGGYAKLSYSQITYLIVNMSDAKENLEAPVFEKVLKLFYKLRSDRKRIKMDMDGYLAVSIDIIKQFNAIAPYEKYSGNTDENETLALIEFIHSSEGIAFYERNIRIVKAQMKKQKAITSVAIFVVVAAIIAFGFYVYEVTIIFDGSPDIYYSETSNLKMALKFTDRNHFSMYVAVPYEDSGEIYAYGVANCVYSGHKWKHLVGPIYLQGNSLLSIRYVESVESRSSMSFYLESVFMYDWWGNDISEDVSDDDETYTAIFDELEDGSVFFDGMVMEPIDDFPDDLKPYWDLLILDE